jgi:hypothetical protein
VFSLGVDRKQEVVTKFPITITNPPNSGSYSQQEVSFAVSPDGCRLAGTILTIPIGSNGLATSSGTWTLQTMKATAGNPAEALHTWTSNVKPNAQGGFENLVLAGWDSVGPVVVVGSDPLPKIRFTPPSAADAPPLKYLENTDFFGGAVAHLGGDGQYGAEVAPATCGVAHVSAGGAVTCYQSGGGQTFRLSAISSTGTTEVAPMDLPNYSYATVGPNGLVAVGYLSGQPGRWQGPDGEHGTLPANFYPEGWVDSRTIFGRGSCWFQCAGAALVRIGGSQPTLEDLGFKGDLVGMLGG